MPLVAYTGMDPERTLVTFNFQIIKRRENRYDLKAVGGCPPNPATPCAVVPVTSVMENLLQSPRGPKGLLRSSSQGIFAGTPKILKAKDVMDLQPVAQTNLT